MQARHIGNIRIVGGHPALDLVNTIGSRRDRVGADYLMTYDDLLLWAARQGVLGEAEAAALRVRAEAEPRGAATALDRAKQLRECLWRCWRDLQAAKGPAAADLVLLTAEAAAAQQVRSLHWRGTGLAWCWTVAGLDAVTNRVAWSAAELLAVGGPLARVRECGGRNCGWLFLDATRNGTRRWCTAEECGSLARVTRFRARRRTVASAG